MIRKFLYVILVMVSAACQPHHTSTSADVNSCAVATVVDVTDKKTLWPIADPLLGIYHYQQYPDEPAWFNLFVISDKVTSPSYNVYLPDAPTDEQQNTQNDPQYRAKRVVSFYGNVRNVFSKVYKDFDTTKAFACSQCWSTIAEALSKLNTLPAAHKYLIIYSDLQEHSSIYNAYKEHTRSSTQAIASKFLNASAIPQKLQEVKVLFVYLPQTRADDARYNQLLRVYRSILEPRGALVSVQTDNADFEL